MMGLIKVTLMVYWFLMLWMSLKYVEIFQILECKQTNQKFEYRNACKRLFYFNRSFFLNLK